MSVTSFLGKGAVLAGIFCASLATVSAETFSVTVVAGHPPINAGVATIRDYFIPEVDRRLAETGDKHKIEWNESYAGALADVRGVLEAIESGIGDFGYVAHLFESDKLPLEQVTYVTPFDNADLKTLVHVVRQLHDYVYASEMTEAWTKNNQKLLAVVGVDNYQLVTNFPVNGVEDLKGRKLCTAGLATNWLRGTGAVPVSSALPDYYNSMQTGLTDGTITFESVIGPYKFYEVAPYITKVDFGVKSASALTVNLDTWKRFPDEVQKIILDVAAGYQTRAAKLYTANAEKSLKMAVDGGAKIIELAPEKRAEFAEILPNIAVEWAKGLDAKGLGGTKVLKAYLELSQKNGVEFARDWLAD